MKISLGLEPWPELIKHRFGKATGNGAGSNVDGVRCPTLSMYGVQCSLQSSGAAMSAVGITCSMKKEMSQVRP